MGGIYEFKITIIKKLKYVINRRTIMAMAIFKQLLLYSGLMLVPLSAPALTFFTQVPYDLSETSPSDIVSADINNDGFIDLIITMSGASGGVGDVVFLLGDGAGNFPNKQNLSTALIDGLTYSPYGVAVGHFNADANIDIAITAGNLLSHDVHIYLGDGAGLFNPSQTVTTTGGSPRTAVSGDFNGDGFADLAVANASGVGAGVDIFLGNGDGSFAVTVLPISDTSFIAAVDISVADFNLDGRLDILIPQMVLINDGNAGFMRTDAIGGSTSLGAVASDLNQDGWPDVVVITSTGIDVWLNDQSGSLLFADSILSVNSVLSGIAEADFDSDGNPDIVVIDENTNQAIVYIGVGDGSFGMAQSFATGNQPKVVVVKDWNGDIAPDIAVPVADIGEPFTSILIQDPAAVIPSAGSLQFSASNYTVDENVTTLSIAVTRIGGSFGNVTVNYATQDNTATSLNQDYVSTSGTLTLLEGELNKTFNITILDDTSYEGDETFFVDLSNATGGAILGSMISAVVTIIDNDPAPSPGNVQFSLAPYSVAENFAAVLVSVSRSGGTAGEISVAYATSDGLNSAVAGIDYSARSSTVIFLDGDDITKTFEINIIDDQVYKGDVFFNVQLNNPIGGVILGTPSNTTVSITDNESPPPGILQFTPAVYSVSEGGGSVLISVIRSGGSAGTVSVDYATSVELADTATTNEDYAATAGTLNFADGELSKSFSVTINDDAIYEGDETFSLSLSNVVGTTVGTSTIAIVNIVENDPVSTPTGSSVLQFSSASYDIAENDKMLLVTVNRTGSSVGSISFSYSTMAGTAIAIEDFVAVTNKTLTLYDGQTSISFNVLIVNDDRNEENESFNINLHDVVGDATLGMPNSSEITIMDDDSTITVDAGTVSITNSGGGGSAQLFLIIILLIGNYWRCCGEEKTKRRRVLRLFE